MAYKKCPKCELNYIMNDTDDLCEGCKNETYGSGGSSKNMNATTVNFTFKKGTSPESKSDIRELRVYEGMQYILVFDENGRCVGVVFSHDEKDAPVHGQAEIGFFEKYRQEYGQWHRIFVGHNGKERLKFAQLEKLLDAEEEYHYAACLNFVKK